MAVKPSEKHVRATAPAPGPAPAPGAAPPAGVQHDLDAFKEDWHTEWRNGNYPGYKHTNPDALPFEDGQSDGKPGNSYSGKSDGPKDEYQFAQRMAVKHVRAAAP